jgi:hypothetical protein
VSSAWCRGEGKRREESGDRKSRLERAAGGEDTCVCRTVFFPRVYTSLSPRIWFSFFDLLRLFRIPHSYARVLHPELYILYNLQRAKYVRLRRGWRICQSACLIACCAAARTCFLFPCILSYRTIASRLHGVMHFNQSAGDGCGVTVSHSVACEDQTAVCSATAHGGRRCITDAVRTVLVPLFS